MPKPANTSDIGSRVWTRGLRRSYSRLARFARRPAKQKLCAIGLKLKQAWHLVFPWIPLPVRLPFGGWWLARNDTISDALFVHDFENAEQRFVGAFLQPNMTVLDIGAHQGFYTLLAAKKVGSGGRVFAFEPSTRERIRLLRHLKLNRYSNAHVEGIALGDHEGEAQLYVVEGRDSGCNSLRFPKIAGDLKRISVRVDTLGNYLRSEKIDRVDFIKMDAEGGDLDILKGASEILRKKPRPVILCELYDIRTRPWGYEAQDIATYLRSFDYLWFTPLADGTLEPKATDDNHFKGNFVAVPRERIDEMRAFIMKPTDGIEGASLSPQANFTVRCSSEV